MFGANTNAELTPRSVVARSNDIIKKLVLEAKRDYEKDAEHRVHIYLADT
jgi:mitochondrial chaperone BCS1